MQSMGSQRVRHEWDSLARMHSNALLSDLDITKICSSWECDCIFGCDYILIPVGLKFVFAHLTISPNTALGFLFLALFFTWQRYMCCQWWDRFRKFSTQRKGLGAHGTFPQEAHSLAGKTAR